MALAEKVGQDAFLIWRPGKIGVRFPNSSLAQARSILLPSFLRPSDKALGVKGSISYIVDGLPSGFDPQEVINKFASREWPVLIGKSVRSPHQLRVLADIPPKELVVPNGATPIILRREFPPHAIDDNESMDDDDGGNAGGDDRSDLSDSPPALPAAPPSSSGPTFVPGWSASGTLEASPPASSTAASSVHLSKKQSTSSSLPSSSTRDVTSNAISRIDKLEAALELITAKQSQMDLQISHNVTQVSNLDSKVDSMKNDSNSMMAMLQVMLQKQDALLAQHANLPQEERRVRQRASLDGTPLGLE
jgi:hypothetical protein